MKTIRTKTLPPSPRRGMRIVARCDTWTETVNANYRLNLRENHARAALALAQKLGLTGKWVGEKLSGEEMVFVQNRAETSFSV